MFSFGGGGGGGKPAGPPVVDGKVFGTGTLVLDEWQLKLLVDPASVQVDSKPASLAITNMKNKDPIGRHGTFSFEVKRKQPGDTAQTVLDRELVALTGHKSYKDSSAKELFASFGITGLSSPITTRALPEGAMAFLHVAEIGNCIFELFIVGGDADQYVTLLRATQAGIQSTAGQTPTPNQCK